MRSAFFSYPVFTPSALSSFHRFDFEEMCDGRCIYRGNCCALGGDGAAGSWLKKARETRGRPSMMSLGVLYGGVGASAALLLAYLVYALICAEEF